MYYRLLKNESVWRRFEAASENNTFQFHRRMGVV